jgi:hypothetical protein
MSDTCKRGNDEHNGIWLWQVWRFKKPLRCLKHLKMPCKSLQVTGEHTRLQQISPPDDELCKLVCDLKKTPCRIAFILTAFSKWPQMCALFMKTSLNFLEEPRNRDEPVALRLGASRATRSLTFSKLHETKLGWQVRRVPAPSSDERHTDAPVTQLRLDERCQTSQKVEPILSANTMVFANGASLAAQHCQTNSLTTPSFRV